MNELVSVIMPAYNMEKYIGDSIKSVLNQNYKNFELIIINDGSSDGTKEIAAKYQHMDERITYIEQENKGVSAARNVGISCAKGKYISFLDADDLWEPTFLSTLINVAEQTGKEWICGKMDIIDTNGNKDTFSQQCKDGCMLDFLTPNGEYRFFWGVGAYIIRRKILEKYHIRFDENISMGEDLCLYIKLFTVTDVKSVPLVVAHYCQHSNSATLSKFDASKWQDMVEIFSLAEPYVEKYRPEWIDKYQQIRDYYAYRFVWSVIKHGMYRQGLGYIDVYEEYLKRFCHTGHKINDRFKCRCLLTKNNLLIKILSGFHREN